MTTTITWMSINLQSGGLDLTPAGPLLKRTGSVDLSRLNRLAEVVALAPARPDVLFVQEAMWWDRHGDELLLHVERQLRRAQLGSYRGFLTRSTRSHHHQVVFIATDRLQPTHHWRGEDPDESRGLYGYVQVVVDDDEHRPVWLKSVHLDPRDGAARLADARQLHAAVVYADPAPQRAIVAGDFNSITSRRTEDQGEPQRHFVKMPAALRYGKGRWPATGFGGDTGPETAALDYLIDCGWTDQHINDQLTAPTTTSGVRNGGDLIIDRCLTYGGLITVPRSVWVDESSTGYSDHRAIGGALRIINDIEVAA